MRHEILASLFGLSSVNKTRSVALAAENPAILTLDDLDQVSGGKAKPKPPSAPPPAGPTTQPAWGQTPSPPDGPSTPPLDD
jgi:hypothetical protein